MHKPMSWSNFFRLLLGDVARLALCKIGRHTSPIGQGYDACARGCGFAHNPDAAKSYRVLLMDGTQFHVDAVNPHHATSLVIYGNGSKTLNCDGTVQDEIKVHPGNIVSVELSTSPKQHDDL